MKKFRIHWINVLASVMLAGMFACSGNELGQVADKHSSTEPGRSVDLITQTIETDTVGGLETALEAAMGEEVGTLQKLIIKGPISVMDWAYVRSLYELVELDMTDTKIVEEESITITTTGYKTISFKNDTICDNMFHGYGTVFDNLELVLLPSDVKYIGKNAFYYCDALKSIEIPSSVKTIAQEAFYDCEALETVKLNEGLATIGAYAFSFTALKSIELPASLTSLGNNAFYNCKELASVSFLGDNLLSIENYTFSNCEALSSIVLPDNLETIGQSAFSECTGLTTITFPESLQNIESQAFRGCSALTDITIPQSVTGLGSRVFEYCTSMKSAKILFNIPLISSYMFSDCNALETVELSSTITKLGDYAFGYCSSLSNPEYFINIKETGEGAFAGCGFETFDCSNMTVFGQYLFNYCENLKSVKLPEEITTLPRGFFQNCPSMTTFEIPSTITTIGEYAFSGSGLTSIDIPANVTTIGSYAFEKTQLTELTIPETVTTAHSQIVSNCEKLFALYWNSSVEVPSNNGTKTCFLYLANGNISYNRNSWKNVVMGDVAELLELNEDNVYTRRASKFTTTKRFLAKKVTYTRRFDDRTYPGKSSGWQTLTLPFTPTSITHESKGVIAPFNSEVEGAKPFWLRELTSEGFKDVTTIEPNKPYIIAMPYDNSYLDEYCLNGDITFSADSVYIEITPETLEYSVGPDFELHPCYEKTAKAANVYSLNSEAYVSGYDYGSVFVRSLDDVYTFEAYVTTLGGGRSARSLFGTTTQSKNTRAANKPNKTGIPQIGDM